MIGNRKPDEKDSRTIFGDLLNSNLPPAEKSIDRMWHDGQVFNIAETETTSWALGNCTYYLLTNPEMLKRVQEELKTVIPDGSIDDIASSELEALPYLVCFKFNGRDSWLIIVQTAVIKESLRLSFGIAGRHYRISPDKPQVLRDGAKEWVIPAGVGFPSSPPTLLISVQTPVGMSNPLVSLHPKVFPSPATFDPSRWLDNPQLDRYLVAFSKGPRGCVGLNLAWAELYFTVAAVFARYGGEERTMRLWKTNV